MTWFGRKLGIALSVLGALVLLAAVGWTWAIGWHPTPTRYTFQGVDLGEAQGEVQWPVVKARGAEFAYLRATIGSEGRDSRFAQNWQEADQAGLRRGAYHVYSLCRRAADQADNFNVTVPHTPDALPAAVVLDFADDCSDRPERDAVLGELRRFLARVEAHTREPVLLKISRSFEHHYRISGAIARPIWETGNFVSPNYAEHPWRMWQASDIRRVDGITGPVDWDVVAP